MTINQLQLTYPDFKSGEVIDAEQFDTNNAQIVQKVNEVIGGLAEQDTRKLDKTGNFTGTWNGVAMASFETGAIAEDITSHKANTSNPHNVTATQAGAVPNTGGTITGGALTLNRDGGSLIFKSVNTGVTANMYMDFRDNTNTRYGYMGYGSGTNNHFLISNEKGDVEFVPGSGYVVKAHAPMHIYNAGNDAELLRLSTERPWTFRQSGIAGDSKLQLRAESTDKYFLVTSGNGSSGFGVYVSDTPNNAFAVTPKLRTDRLQGDAVWDLINLGSGNAHIDTRNSASRFSHDTNNYTMINTSGVNFYHGGRGVGRFCIGDNGTTHSFLQGQGSGIQLLGANGGVQARTYDNANYTPMFASAFTQNSRREDKKNIMEFTENATELIQNTKVYSYQYLNELEGELPHTGLILDEAPVQLVDPTGEGVDLYAMVSLLWKSNQELNARIQVLEAKLQ